MDINKIYVVSPHGFCAGVARAIDTVEKVLHKHGRPVYVRHHIVHNVHVVKDFEKKGVIFVEDIDKVPPRSVVVFSAHGSPPELYIKAHNNKLTLYDATCPLVTKVHLEAKRYAGEGYHIIYIGYKGHAEGIGVMGEVSEDSITQVDSVNDVGHLLIPPQKKIVILTQTTLSLDDIKGVVGAIQKKYPHSILPPALDICYATQNRQNAVKILAKKAKLILVIGSKASSNSNKLREVAEKTGAKAYLIDDETDIDPEWLKNVQEIGITAGASVPEKLVRGVIDFLSNNNTVIEYMETAKEAAIFSLPKNL
ncbi:4-hydroxy-3-methylbut-2-enyl diphosphate reductase [Candidatus Roizmanbacteria bacterium CG_4_10_14_0_8_um_filter_39_9]|uniref:4-hydroxy-3-methylbut-2-enyl diphosphate reductase n=1 Tax=Candidatus Roizmanbacteria bacterium CG_4_10_14_0_8_um_filter_39_9 TaxID=1974829 RepID=A0A2M7QET0_9BACT|nr:MAG: 4-hydroxy-3-methylbut-2-enyl diphosphate reductase [Candidatus Roizmanbacteria bacterium CG_4_10_14_0_8_um_filter_39_9]